MGKAALTLLAFLACLPVFGGTPHTLRAGHTLRLDQARAGALVAVTAATKSKSPQAWGVEWTDTCGRRHAIAIGHTTEDFGGLNHRHGLQVSLTQADSLVDATLVERGVELNGKPNTLRLLIDRRNRLYWTLGARAIAAAGNIELDTPPAEGTFTIFTTHAPLNIESWSVAPDFCPQPSIQTRLTHTTHFTVPDDPASSPQGIWKALDHDNKPEWSRPGGDYTLGIAADSIKPGTFNIIFLDGATVNATAWKAGMVKGTLSATPFSRHYNLRWVDATMNTLSEADECSATLDDSGATLTFHFPLQHATLRFHRPLNP